MWCNCLATSSEIAILHLEKILGMREILEKLETQMRHQFEMVRAKFEHSGNKGTNAETILRNFLREYLPRRYGVGHGEIIDSQGHRSAQTDIVIVTDEHPFTFTADQRGLFFVEGVSQ